MKVLWDSLKASNRFDFKLPQPVDDNLYPIGFTGNGPDLRVEMQVVKSDGNYCITTSITGMLHLLCNRCGSEFDRDLVLDSERCIVESVDNADAEHDSEHRRLEKTELDRTLVSGAQLDLAMFAVEEILLYMPSVTVCRESCKGICQYCLINLNLSSCDCSSCQATGSGSIKGLEKIKKPESGV